jgi:hypothetical protein
MSVSSRIRFTCRPGVSEKFKGKVGLFATKKIKSNDKIVEKPHYVGRWIYTKDLAEIIEDPEMISSLQDLYKNKRLFMSNEQRVYTFVPQTPVREFHADMFLNQSKKFGNVLSKPDGYYAFRDIEKGEELIIV